MKTVVKKWGNSLGIRIPSALVKEYGMNDGSKLELIQRKEGFLLVPMSKKDRLFKMLAKIDSSNIHAEEDFGGVEGNEGW